MADNKINVTVSANTRKNITVSSTQQSTEITASTDTGRFWAQTSKNWAVSDVIVDNTDYSSKHYAGIAKESAENAQNIEEIVKNNYNAFLEASMTANSELQATKENAITEIENNKINAVDSMNAVKNDAVDSINSTKTTILNDIEFVADGEKQEINELADVIKDNANTVNTAIEAGVERLNSIDSLKNNQITNCLLEVPQRIKYELNDGTLTIKAGSVVIVPYGTTDRTSEFPVGSTFLHENFKVVDTQFVDGKFFVWAELVSDIVSSQVTTTADSLRLMAISIQGETYTNALVANVHTISADALPDNTRSYQWYQTNTNKCFHVNASRQMSTISFPIGICISSATTYFGSINQVFNGMGYIGSTIWVDKDVKGLIPNGRNEDGTLRNIEIISDQIKTHTVSAGDKNISVYMNSNGTIGDGHSLVVSETPPSQTYKLYYKEQDNELWTTGNNKPVRKYAFIFAEATMTYNNGIASFNPKQPFRAVDWNDLNDLLPTGTVISSASTISPLGFLYCNGSAISRTAYAKLFKEIGTTYGTGDGSTTFNLPNYSNYNFVTSATVSVKGNGKGLGLYNGSQYISIHYGMSQAGSIGMNTSGYGKNVGAVQTHAVPTQSYATAGVTTDASKSGLTGIASTAKMNWYIKY